LSSSVPDDKSVLKSCYDWDSWPQSTCFGFLASYLVNKSLEYLLLFVFGKKMFLN